MPRLLSRRAFTLIELLVVISIISLLVAMLLPALRSARGAAEQVQCLSHQRQFGVGVASYGVDWDEWAPVTSNYYQKGHDQIAMQLGLLGYSHRVDAGPKNDSSCAATTMYYDLPEYPKWNGTLYSYYENLPTQVISGSIFHCPSQQPDTVWSYGYNIHMGAPYNDKPSNHIFKQRYHPTSFKSAPSVTSVMVCGSKSQYNTYSAAGAARVDIMAPQHIGETGTILLFDGHASTLNIADFAPSYPGYYYFDMQYAVNPVYNVVGRTW